MSPSVSDARWMRSCDAARSGPPTFGGRAALRRLAAHPQFRRTVPGLSDAGRRLGRCRASGRSTPRLDSPNTAGATPASAIADYWPAPTTPTAHSLGALATQQVRMCVRKRWGQCTAPDQTIQIARWRWFICWRRANEPHTYTSLRAVDGRLDYSARRTAADAVLTSTDVYKGGIYQRHPGASWEWSRGAKDHVGSGLRRNARVTERLLRRGRSCKFAIVLVGQPVVLP